MSVPNINELRRIESLTLLISNLKSEVEQAKNNLQNLKLKLGIELSSAKEKSEQEKINKANLEQFEKKVSDIQNKEFQIKEDLNSLIASSLDPYFASTDFKNFTLSLISNLEKNGEVQVLASTDMSKFFDFKADESLESGTLKLITKKAIYTLNPEVLRPKLHSILTRVLIGTQD